MEITQVKAYGTIAADKPLEAMEIKRRALQPKDVAFEVLYCGICHSDLHQIKNDFGSTMWPIVPGHEIVGRVTGVGSADKAVLSSGLAQMKAAFHRKIWK